MNQVQTSSLFFVFNELMKVHQDLSNSLNTARIDCTVSAAQRAEVFRTFYEVQGIYRMLNLACLLSALPNSMKLKYEHMVQQFNVIWLEQPALA